MQNTSQHSLTYENSTHYCSIQKDHSQMFSIVFIMWVVVRTQSTFLLNFPKKTILNIRKKPFALNKKNSLSITFMLKWPSSLTLLSLRIISLNRTSIIQRTVYAMYAALKLKEDHFIFIFSGTPEEKLKNCHISFAGKPVFILG